MKAIINEEYGSAEVLQLRELDIPVVKPDQALIRVRAASVNPWDWHHTTGVPYIMRMGGGLRRPTQIRRGVDFAGEVVAVGPDVTRFRPGDEVFGQGGGAFAEYVRVAEGGLVLKPSGVTFEQAAAVPMAALTALQGLRAGGLRAGRRVLVIGASGGVGTFAVQLAVAAGAEVTAVCSTGNVPTARSLGARHVLDYTREDFLHSGERYDLILDVVGNRSIGDRRRVLSPDGALVVVGGPKTNRWIGPMGSFITLPLAAIVTRRRLRMMLARPNQEDLLHLAALLEDGSLRPVIERVCSLEEAAAAVDHVGQGHARGKVVIAV